jgi:tRNA-dihydrouridine synthase A
VRQLKHDFPAAAFVLNGGLTSLPQAAEQWAGLDGVMLGRSAYHDPYLLAGVDRAFHGEKATSPTREEVVTAMDSYLHAHAGTTSPRHVVRHMHGLYQGVRGARQWRRVLSDADELGRYGADILQRALTEVTPAPEADTIISRA